MRLPADEVAAAALAESVAGEVVAAAALAVFEATVDDGSSPLGAVEGTDVKVDAGCEKDAEVSKAATPCSVSPIAA